MSTINIYLMEKVYEEDNNSNLYNIMSPKCENSKHIANKWKK